MTGPMDAATLAALRQQHHELTATLAQLERARAEHLPSPGPGWTGVARRAFGVMLDAIGSTLDTATAATRSARDHTARVLSEGPGGV